MMKALRILLPAALLFAGCEKSSNVAAMQDETAGLANAYRSRFEELNKRYVQIDRSKVKPEIDASKDIKPVWVATGRKLTELRNTAAQAQNAIAAATKSANPSLDLIRLQADLRERLERGEVEVTANLHAIESWITNRAYAQKVAAADTGTAAGNAHGTSDLDKVDAKKDELDAVNTDMPKTGVHDNKPDAAKTEPKTDGTAPKTDAKKDAAKTDAPKTDVKKDAPKTEPKKDAPKKDAPKTEPKNP